MDRKKLIIIDSFALIFRAYYAYPPTLTTKEGQQINAVYGFTSLLIDVIKKFKPEYLVAVFDSQTATIRSTEFSEYKANRKETDNELIEQIPLVRKVLQAFNIPVLTVDGYEADDVIGTLVKTFSPDKSLELIVVTGDQDLFQLISEGTSVYLAGRSFAQSKLFNREEVKLKMGVYPEQVPDYKAICGDSSDNIPGVKGLGKKGAESLITEFETLENVYKNLDKVSPSVGKKLMESYEIAFKSKELATVVCDVPLSFDLADSFMFNFDPEEAKEAIEEFSFKSLVAKLEDVKKIYGIKDPDTELTLFSDNVESESPVVDTLKLDDLKGVKKIYILAKLGDLIKSSLHYNLENFYIKTDEVSGQININELPSLFKQFQKNNTKIITINSKEMFHAVMNLDVGVSKELIESSVDLGFLTKILSLSTYDKDLKDIFRFCEIDCPSSQFEQLECLPELHKYLEQKIESTPKSSEIIELEHGILGQVIQMERNGIQLDQKLLAEYQKNLEILKESLSTEIYNDAGHEFNINSPKQVAEVIYVEKGLPATRKTKGGAYTTNETELKKMIGLDPIIKRILDYREVDKLISTYLSTLPDYAEKDGRVYAVFDQMGTVSGRFSSRNPNMQNIPLDESHGVNVRDAFQAKEGNLLYAFDYSQQELRILASLAGEEKMIEAFNNGQDVHLLTASEIFDIDIDQVTKKQRNVGKTINFSIVYGISGFGLSERMRIDRKKAEEFIKKYNETYGQITNFLEMMKKEVYTKQYAETVFGRKRFNKLIRAGQWYVRAAAERELLNFVIQGSAADIMKMAMLKFDSITEKYNAKLVAQIHDEFLFEIPNSSNQKEFSQEVMDLLANIYKMDVKFDVNVKSGERWGSLK